MDPTPIELLTCLFIFLTCLFIFLDGFAVDEYIFRWIGVGDDIVGPVGGYKGGEHDVGDVGGCKCGAAGDDAAVYIYAVVC